ncbi:Ig-like domain-containing protein [Gallaecimonas sp. GXIMD1310]|uniref:Ig-like domain-containing protein n=1 Tax=Gallaecimonas sp. GXIMD1310 TaxID=3131926 RepID=UPI0032533C81
MRRLWLLVGMLLAFSGYSKELVLVSADLAGQVKASPGQTVRVLTDLGSLPAALDGGVWSRVSVVSHGAPGELLIAGQRLDRAFLTRHPQLLAAWPRHLTPAAQVELWGCDVARGQGQGLVDTLTADLGRPVLASTDATGPASLGGNLRLEYGQGRAPDSAPVAQLQQLLALSSSNSQDFENTGDTDNTFYSSPHTFGSFTIYSNSTGTPSNQRMWLNSSYTHVGTEGLYVASQSVGDLTEVRVVGSSTFQLKSIWLGTASGLGDPTAVLHAYKGGSEIGTGRPVTVSNASIDTSGYSEFHDIDEVRITGVDLDFIMDNIMVDVPVTQDADGNLSAGSGSEPGSIATNAGSTAALDFTLSDGGGGDGQAMTVSQVQVHVSGTSTATDRSNVVWSLTGPDISGSVTGSYSAGVVTFSGLAISVADGGSETYTVNADLGHSGITDGHSFVLSLDGDTDLTVGGSGTQMGTTTAVNNGAGFTASVVANKLVFTTQPAGSVSGSALTTQPVVQAQDSFGNTDINFTGNVSLSEASAGALSGTTTVAASSGVATFTNVAYTATADQQSFTLTASATGLTDGTANAVTSDVVATQLVFATQPAPTSISSGSSTSFSTVPVVKAVDANNTLDTGYSTDVVLAVSNSAGSLPAGTVNTLSGTGDTDGNGITVTLTPSAGSATFSGLALQYTNNSSVDVIALHATSGGLTAATSTAITSSSGPTVTDANISISGASGTGGAFKIGDTVTATWNNTIGGDNNSGVTGVTMDFSQFGGGSSVVASNSSDTWTATYTITAGSIDTSNRNVSVSATTSNGTSTTADTTNATVDNIAPTVTDANISISGASGTSGTFIAGDTVTATWNNTAAGDNNTDSLAGVTVNFSAFGGGSSVAASNSAGTWTATYTLPAGTLEVSNRNVSVTATDNAGNQTTAADTSNASIDTQAPVAPSAPVLAASSDSGSSNSDNLTNDTTPLLTGTAVANATVRIFDGASQVGSGVANSSGNWSITTSTLSDGSHSLTAKQLDSAGNLSAASTALAITIDSSGPSGYNLAVSPSPVNNSNETASMVTFSSAEVGSDYQLSISSNGGGTPIVRSGTVTSANQQLPAVDVSSLSDGTLTYSLTLQDNAGNSGSPATKTVQKDTQAPTGYSASLQGNVINIANQSTQTLTMSGAEVGAQYALTISDGGASPVSRSGTVSGANMTIGSLDLSGLADGNVQISLTLTDTAGNAGTAYTSSVVKDTVAPTLVSSTPANNAINVALRPSPSLTFSEPVLASSGASDHLTLTASDNTVVFDSAAASSDVSVNGNTVALTLNSDLVPTLVHSLNVGANALTDAAGNPFAGGNVLQFTAADGKPVANNDSFTLTEDTPKQLAVLSNDTVQRGSLNAASLVVTTAPLHGSLALDTGTGVLTYQPDADYNGIDSFTYQVQDSYGFTSNNATVQLSISAVNDAPRTQPDSTTTQVGQPVSIDVLANDSDIDSGDSVDASSLVVASAPSQGVAVASAGKLLYTPPANFSGVVSLTYQVADNHGALSPETTVTIVVQPSGAPVAVNDTATVAEDTAKSINVLANDTGSVDANTLTVVTPPKHGQVQVLAGQLQYQSAANYNGADSFSYRVADGNGASSNVATVSLTVTAVNDAPVANPDTVVVSGTAPVDINVKGNDSDVDSPISTATIILVQAPSAGTASISGGFIRYTPPSSGAVNDSFQYSLRDSSGAVSAAAVVTISTSAVNQAPLAANDSAIVNQNSSVLIDVLANDSDADGSLDASSLNLTTPGHGTAVVEAGKVRYTPDAQYHGTDSFTYRVSDTQGAQSAFATVSVQVQVVNQAPIAVADSATVPNDAPTTLSVLSNDNDPDGTLAGVIVRTAPTHGTAVAQSDGTVIYTPTSGYTGSDSFNYVAVDDLGAVSNEVTVSLSVFQPNRAPVISGNPATSVLQDKPYQFQPTASDADSDPLTFSISNKPAWATFDSQTGLLQGTPGNSDVGTDSNIVITVSDGKTQSSLAAFNITVVNVNDPPVAQNDSYSLAEGGILTVPAAQGVLANDSDPDNNSLTATLVSGPAYASSFTLNADGSFSYQHNGSEHHSDQFRYQVSDGQGGVAEAVVNLAITPVNDPPAFVSTPPTTLVAGSTLNYVVAVQDPDSAPSLTLVSGPSWLQLNGNTLTGTAPASAAGSDVPVVLQADDGQLQVQQSFTVSITAASTSQIRLTSQWLGLPAKVHQPLQLTLSVLNQSGPALNDATVVVHWQGRGVPAANGCRQVDTQTLHCPLTLASGARYLWRLTLDTSTAGDQSVSAMVLGSDQKTLASSHTDVSISDDTLSQGDINSIITKATAITMLSSEGERYLAAGTDGQGVTLYRLDNMQPVAVTTLDDGGHVAALASIDWNHDGLNDLVVLNRDTTQSAIYLNQGSEQFTAGPALPAGSQLQLHDTDGDGYTDLLIGVPGLYRLPGSANGQSQLQVVQATLPISHFSAVGHGGLVTSKGGTLRYGSISTGALNNAVADSSEVLTGEISTLATHDLNGDGLPDVVVGLSPDAEGNGGGIAVLSIDANGQWQMQAQTGNAAVERVMLGDMNGDGLDELLVQHQNGSWQRFSQSGDLRQWTLAPEAFYLNDSLGLVADLNGDGLADLLLANTEDGTLAVYQGSASNQPGPQADVSVSATLGGMTQQMQRQYRVTVQNQGPADSTQTQLLLNIPEGLLLTGQPSQCVQAGSLWQCAIGAIASGQQQALTLTLSGSASAADIKVLAVVSGSAGDPDTANNSAANVFGENWTAPVTQSSSGGGGSLGWWWLASLWLIWRRRQA